MVRPKTKERRGHRTYHGKHKNAQEAALGVVVGMWSASTIS